MFLVDISDTDVHPQCIYTTLHIKGNSWCCECSSGFALQHNTISIQGGIQKVFHIFHLLPYLKSLNIILSLFYLELASASLRPTKKMKNSAMWNNGPKLLIYYGACKYYC